MAFGQAAGPPAPAKDVARLAELLDQLGFCSFKEARHPYGLTQRQAAGRFTRDEAEELLGRLEAEVEVQGAGAASPAGEPEPSRSPARTTRSASAAQQRAVAGATDEVLVAELELRGWTCIAPTP